MKAYTFIRRWCQYVGMDERQTLDRVLRAEATFAPEDAVYELPPRSGKWITAPQVLSRNLRRHLGLIP